MTEKDNTTEPLVSFIIADYNLPLTLLSECVDSILAVNLLPQEREIILVDDGSYLSPWPELTHYHGSVKYIRQDNQGLSVARNTGMEQARGKYIQFVDGDDCLIKKNYDIIIDKLRKPGSYLQSVDIIMFRESYQKTARPSLSSLLRLFWYTPSKDYLKRKNIRGSAWGYVFRREIARGLRFTPGILHEDEEFTPLLLLRTDTVLFTSIKAYYYRWREASITNCREEEHVDKRFRDFLGIILRLRHHSLTSGGEALTRRVHQLTMDYLYNAMTTARGYEKFRIYIQPLREYRLLPLPIRPYTAKYVVFSLLTRTVAGRRMLYNILSRL